MKDFFDKIKQKLGTGPDVTLHEEGEDEYLELETASEEIGRKKLLVRTFIIDTFEGIKEILDSLRAGHTVALVNIKPLKDKDLVELKRAISKLKKTCEAIDGDIAGFGEDYIVCTPSVAEIYRTSDIHTDMEIDRELE